jgi:hypothetical protein
MSSIRRAALALGITLVLLSCDSGDVTPDGSTPPTPPAAPLPPADPPPATTLAPPAQMSGTDLTLLLASELARIAARQVQSVATYDSLKVEWDAFLARQRILEPSALLRCDPLQFTGSASIVGPDGGDIDVGPHTLRVPPGALPWDAVITVEAPTGLEVGIELSPKGVGFREKLVLEIDYKHCTVSDTLPPLRGVWVSDSGTVMEFPPTVDDRQNGRLSVELDHFSKYAVAY